MDKNVLGTCRIEKGFESKKEKEATKETQLSNKTVAKQESAKFGNRNNQTACFNSKRIDDS